MKFGGIGWLELVIILVVVLLIFGPKNLPKLGNAIGKTVSNLREGMNAGKKKDDEEAEAEEDEAPSGDQPAAIEGEVVEVEDSDGDEEEVVETISESAEAPKKVRKVVKKKTEEPQS